MSEGTSGTTSNGAAPPPPPPAEGDVLTADAGGTKAPPAAETKPADKAPIVDPKLEAEKAAKEFDAWKPKLPDGAQLDEKAFGEFKPLAKELGLKTESAQKVVDLYLKLDAARAEEVKATRESWGKELRDDKEFGGKNYDASVESARKAVAWIDAKLPGFKAELKEAGLGNWPLLTKALRIVGQGLAEDAVIGTGNGAQSPATSEDALMRALYPSHFQKEP